MCHIQTRCISKQPILTDRIIGQMAEERCKMYEGRWKSEEGASQVKSEKG